MIIRRRKRVTRLDALEANQAKLTKLTGRLDREVTAVLLLAPAHQPKHSSPVAGCPGCDAAAAERITP